MVRDDEPQKQPRRRGLWFQALLLLDAFVLGGLTVAVLLNNYAEYTMSRMNPWVPSDAFGVIPHMQDKLILYFVIGLGIALLLGLITLGVVAWRITGSWRRSGEFKALPEQG